MEILFNIFSGEELRVWFGEDLVGYTESDNHGTSCADVYFELIERKTPCKYTVSLSFSILELSVELILKLTKIKLKVAMKLISFIL